MPHATPCYCIDGHLFGRSNELCHFEGICQHAVRQPYMQNFVLTAGVGFGNLGGHIALAAWAGPRTMPADWFPLLIEDILCPRIMPSFISEGVTGRYIGDSRKETRLYRTSIQISTACDKAVTRKWRRYYGWENLWHPITDRLRSTSVFGIYPNPISARKLVKAKAMLAATTWKRFLAEVSLIYLLTETGVMKSL